MYTWVFIIIFLHYVQHVQAEMCSAYNGFYVQRVAGTLCSENDGFLQPCHISSVSGSCTCGVNTCQPNFFCTGTQCKDIGTNLNQRTDSLVLMSPTELVDEWMMRTNEKKYWQKAMELTVAKITLNKAQGQTDNEETQSLIDDLERKLEVLNIYCAAIKGKFESQTCDDGMNAAACACGNSICTSHTGLLCSDSACSMGDACQFSNYFESTNTQDCACVVGVEAEACNDANGMVCSAGMCSTTISTNKEEEDALQRVQGHDNIINLVLELASAVTSARESKMLMAVQHNLASLDYTLYFAAKDAHDTAIANYNAAVRYLDMIQAAYVVVLASMSPTELADEWMMRTDEKKYWQQAMELTQAKITLNKAQGQTDNEETQSLLDDLRRKLEVLNEYCDAIKSAFAQHACADGINAAACACGNSICTSHTGLLCSDSACSMGNACQFSNYFEPTNTQDCACGVGVEAEACNDANGMVCSAGMCSTTISTNKEEEDALQLVQGHDNIINLVLELASVVTSARESKMLMAAQHNLASLDYTLYFVAKDAHDTAIANYNAAVRYLDMIQAAYVVELASMSPTQLENLLSNVPSDFIYPQQTVQVQSYIYALVRFIIDKMTTIQLQAVENAAKQEIELVQGELNYFWMPDREALTIQLAQLAQLATNTESELVLLAINTNSELVQQRMDDTVREIERAEQKLSFANYNIYRISMAPVQTAATPGASTCWHFRYFVDPVAYINGQCCDCT